MRKFHIRLTQSRLEEKSNINLKIIELILRHQHRMAFQVEFELHFHSSDDLLLLLRFFSLNNHADQRLV